MPSAAYFGAPNWWNGITSTGARSWEVVVLGGAATVLGTFRDHAEEPAATALAASVPGVRSVVVQPCAASA